MNFTCPKCTREIKPENVNISTDLAKCDNCGSIFKASELVENIEKKDLTPPSGSKIVIQKGLNESLEFTYPKKGVTLALVPQLLFAIFWLGFIAFWTIGASKGSVIFALFSIPFWLIGFNMIIGIINSANEIQVITLDKYKLTVKKMRPIKASVFETDVSEIQSIKMKPIKMDQFALFKNFRNVMKMQSSFGAAVEQPSIITGRKTEYFFDDANDAEQEWITSVLDNLVRKIKARN